MPVAASRLAPIRIIPVLWFSKEEIIYMVAIYPLIAPNVRPLTIFF